MYKQCLSIIYILSASQHIGREEHSIVIYFVLSGMETLTVVYYAVVK